ncbi:type II secretion system protein [Candidatus Parcubacteria bacterium]|jgi:prepilin-type N-terminal cleavage/methylation domain-containing protein|nr:MAG: type II secretion system protein [Candidatus Parcubacteria bacterium]
MKQNKGFTLIEMLVVVGMIGVLAAAVLTALGPSRQKARDSRVISGLNQAAAIAESKFDGSSYPATIDATIEADIKKFNNNQNVTYTAPANTGTFAISSPLPSGGAFCVDSAGKRASSTASNGICP